MSQSHLFLSGLVVVAGLLPFALVMLTSFVKMAVVLSIVRSALGVPQVPPNAVVTGLALVLSLVVMAPVAEEMGRQAVAQQQAFEGADLQAMWNACEQVSAPLRGFLLEHSHEALLQRFADLLTPGELAPTMAPGWPVLVPAFVISQLQDAFTMGFVIFLPFLVLDMLVASVLLSLGMHMLSPVTISLPFKLLLFSLADGWTLLGESLLGSFAWTA